MVYETNELSVDLDFAMCGLALGVAFYGFYTLIYYESGLAAEAFQHRLIRKAMLTRVHNSILEAANSSTEEETRARVLKLIDDMNAEYSRKDKHTFSAILRKGDLPSHIAEIRETPPLLFKNSSPYGPLNRYDNFRQQERHDKGLKNLSIFDGKFKEGNHSIHLLNIFYDKSTKKMTSKDFHRMGFASGRSKNVEAEYTKYKKTKNFSFCEEFKFTNLYDFFNYFVYYHPLLVILITFLISAFIFYKLLFINKRNNI